MSVAPTTSHLLAWVDDCARLAVAGMTRIARASVLAGPRTSASGIDMTIVGMCSRHSGAWVDGSAMLPSSSVTLVARAVAASRSQKAALGEFMAVPVRFQLAVVDGNTALTVSTVPAVASTIVCARARGRALRVDTAYLAHVSGLEHNRACTLHRSTGAAALLVARQVIADAAVTTGLANTARFAARDSARCVIALVNQVTVVDGGTQRSVTSVTRFALACVFSRPPVLADSINITVTICGELAIVYHGAPTHGAVAGVTCGALADVGSWASLDADSAHFGAPTVTVLAVVDFDTLATITFVASVACTRVLSWASVRTSGMFAAVMLACVAVVDGPARLAVALEPFTALASVCARACEGACCLVCTAMCAIFAVVDGLALHAVAKIPILAITFVGGLSDTSALRILVAIINAFLTFEIFHTQLAKALEASIA